ncbi:MAG: glycosyltransferase family 39 protein [Thermoguttaceae bacterium]|jgi:hypothetical protein
MNNRDEYLHNLPADYCNRLAAPEPLRPHYPCRILLLLVLVLACIIPRAVIALRLSSICPDGVLYIRLAEALKEGRFSQAFEIMNLNIYPGVLMVLNRLGLSWETGGMIWGILISGLVVLPLFGWVRRQFDDTVALAACLLYAVHPIFIQWSPEIIRDPTFWFFFTLSLYLLWRAVTEVRVGFWFAAGLALTFAVLTRFEGLFLLIPLGLWTFWRRRALIGSRDRAKLAAGAALSVVAFPALILLVNFTLLRHYPQWVSMRFAPLSLIHYWWNGMFFHAPVNTAGDETQIRTYISLGRMIAIYVPTLVKGLSPLFALLMLGGLWKWRRVWSRRDHQPLFYTTMAIMLAAWIHAWCAKGSCDRYFLPIVLMASPFAALGLLAFTGRLLCFAERLNNKAILRYVAVFAPVIIVVFTGWNVAFSGPYDRREAEVKLADWVRQQYGPSALIFGSEGVTPVVAYYAKASWSTLWINMDDRTVLEKIKQLRPDVILLMATRRKDSRDTKQLIDKIEKLEYAEIARSNLPHGMDDVLVVLNRGDVEPPVNIETGGKTVSRK